MGMGFAPTWFRQVSPPASHDHFNHCWMSITECKPTSGGGHYLYLQTQFGGDRCTQFRVIVVIDPQTNKQTQPQTHRQDRLQYTVPQLARSVMTSFVDGQPSDIISLHCAHCALTHDTVPPGSGRGTSPRITNGGNGICLEFPSFSLNI